MGGIPLSALNKFGLPGVNSLATDKLYDRYIGNKQIKNFNEFHVVLIDICKDFNIILPSKDFIGPSTDVIKEFFNEKWVPLKDDDVAKKAALRKFLEEHFEESRAEDSANITVGLVAPAAAIVLKKAGSNLPAVRRLQLHRIPDVVFVPLFTLISLVGVRASQIQQLGKHKP